MMLRFVSIALLLAFAFGCGGSGEPSGKTASFRLQGEAVRSDPDGADYLVDFGRVELGRRTTPELFFVNDGREPLTIRISRASLEGPFSLSETSFEVPARSRRSLELAFAPTWEGTFESHFDLRLPQLGEVRQVRLLGAGGSVDCAPTEVDLGPVVLGESRTALVTCENPLDSPATVTIGSFLHASPSHFSATFADGTAGPTATIPPGGSAGIEVHFAAVDQTGPASALLPLFGGNGQELVRVDIQAEAIAHALQVYREGEDGDKLPLASCLPFSPLGIGSSEARTLYLRNLGQSPVELTEVALGETDAFALLTPFTGSVTLAPGDELEFVLAYEPQTSEAHHATLTIDAAEERAVPAGGLSICLNGTSAGPSLACDVEEVDFGPVAVGASVRHTFRCRNTAVPTPNSPPLLLHLDGVLSDDLQFVAGIRNLDGTLGAKPGYAPGEAFLVDLRFFPSAVGPQQARVVLRSDALGTPGLEIDAVGEGRNLPPCVVDIQPPTLEFGVVAPGETKVLAVHVTNASTQDACILSNLRLGEDADPAFAMEAVRTVILEPTPPGNVAAGAHRHPVRVSFTPTEERSYGGSVELFVSDPLDGERSIALTGMGAQSCVQVDVEVEDFGVGELHCAGRPALVSIANFCADDVRVESVGFEGAPGPFVLPAVGGLPARLEEGERFEFSVAFHPEAVGAYEGALRIEVGEADGGDPLGPFLVPLRGEAPGDGRLQTDRFEPRPRVDLLVVADNSAAVPVDRLQGRIGILLDAAFRRNHDFQVGVTTTGLSESGIGACPPTGFDEDEDGRLVPHPSLGSPRILRAELGKGLAAEHLERNLDVGHCHANEAPFEAARRALSSPWIHTPGELAGNAGFLRRDASLAILGITDEEDQSYWKGDGSQDRSIARYVEFFQKRKPSWRRDEVKVHMISGGQTGCTSATGSASPCARCEEGTTRTGGTHLSLCETEPGWDTGIEAIGDAIFAPVTRFRLRGQPADHNQDGRVDETDLVVRVDGTVRQPLSPTGARVWNYDESSHSVIFNRLFAPQANQLLEIGYSPGCAAP